MRSNKRGAVVGASLGLFAASLSLTACGNHTADQAQICIDKNTQQRLPDNNCNPGYSHAGISPVWYWIMLNSNRHRGVDYVPGIGQRVSVGSYGHYGSPFGTGGRVAKGVGSHGESVSHGGFGTSSHGGSGE